LASKSGNETATKQQHVAALLPLGGHSKFPFEVLRLGLEGTNPRISLTPLVAIQINLGIDALFPGFRKSRLGKRDGDDTGHQNLPALARLLRSGLSDNKIEYEAGNPEIVKHPTNAAFRRLPGSGSLAEGEKKGPYHSNARDLRQA
jgi:hypothetical protein